MSQPNINLNQDNRKNYDIEVMFNDMKYYFSFKIINEIINLIINDSQENKYWHTFLSIIDLRKNHPFLNNFSDDSLVKSILYKISLNHFEMKFLNGQLKLNFVFPITVDYEFETYHLPIILDEFVDDNCNNHLFKKIDKKFIKYDYRFQELNKENTSLHDKIKQISSEFEYRLQQLESNYKDQITKIESNMKMEFASIPSNFNQQSEINQAEMKSQINKLTQYISQLEQKLEIQNSEIKKMQIELRSNLNFNSETNKKFENMFTDFNSSKKLEIDYKFKQMDKQIENKINQLVLSNQSMNTEIQSQQNQRITELHSELAKQFDLIKNLEAEISAINQFQTEYKSRNQIDYMPIQSNGGEKIDLNQHKINNENATLQSEIDTHIPKVQNHISNINHEKDGDIFEADKDESMNKNVTVLKGHIDCIRSLLYIPYDNIASGSDDTTIRIWKIATGECIQILRGHTDFVRSLAYLPEKVIASGSDDKTIRLWNPTTGICISVLKGHTDWVSSLLSLPDGLIASGSDDTTIRIWSTTQGKSMKTLKGHSSYVRCLTYLHDELFASGSGDKTIKIWNVTTGECNKTLKEHTDSFYSLVTLPGGLVASGSAEKTIRIWNVTSGECIKTLEGHTRYVYSLISLKNGLIASGCDDTTIRIWDTNTGECIDTLEGHIGYVCSLIYLHDKLIASASWDKTIRIWNTSSTIN